MRLGFHRVAPKHQVSQHRSKQTARIPVQGKGNRRGQGMGRDTGRDTGRGKSREGTIQEAAASEVATSVVATSVVAASWTTAPAHSRVRRAICYFGLGLGPCSDLGPCPDLAPGHGPPNPGGRPCCLEHRGYLGYVSSNHPDDYPMRQNDHLRLASCPWEVRAPVGPKLMSCRGSYNPSI